MKNNLSQMWYNIQETLFPHMEEELGPLSKKLLQVIQIGVAGPTVWEFTV